MDFFDSHCHLPPHGRHEKTAGQILKDAADAGVVGCVAIGTSICENENVLRIVKEHQNVYAAIGIYPHEDKDVALADLRQCLSAQIASCSKVVAIGECGIDVSEKENGRQIQDQINLFEMQIELAMKYHLPIIIHNRNGDNEVLALMKKYASQGLRGVAHCFSQSWEYAQQLLQCGLYISFSGMITYKARKGILETVRNAPIDRILIETDSPDLQPEGFRGQVNEPKNVFVIAQKIAYVRGMLLDDIAQKTYENAKTLFRIH